MSLLHNHFTILILLVEAILASLMSGPLLLEFLLKLTILLGELLFADLVVAKLSRQAGPEVVSLALNHSHLIVDFVNFVLHVPGVARQLDSQLLDRGLLLADHSFLLLQLIVEEAFKLAVVALSGDISTRAVGRLVAFGGCNRDSAEVEGIFRGRRAHSIVCLGILSEARVIVASSFNNVMCLGSMSVSASTICGASRALSER